MENVINTSASHSEIELNTQQFTIGENPSYPNMCGITFKGTTNPKAQKPSIFINEYRWPTGSVGIKDIGDYLMSLDTFVDAMQDEANRVEGEVRLYGDGEEEVPKLDPAVKIIQSSWSEGEQGFVSELGLSAAILEAYSYHHDLVLRPDNFWQAILTQFGFYMLGNAEELRDRIVDFQGKTKLVVGGGRDIFTTDFGACAEDFVDEISKNIRDPSIAEWLLPSFTTTSPSDRIAASVSVMSAMQKYFSYEVVCGCGIPNVTLLGEVADWEVLRSKIDRLLEFEVSGNNYMETWHAWLAYVCDKLVESASGSPDMHFWETIIKHEPNGSCEGHFTGWMSSFNVFTHKGEWQGDNFEFPEDEGYSYDTEDSDDEQVKHDSDSDDEQEKQWFPIINPDDICKGICFVPVKVIDGQKEYDCTMFAGHLRSEIKEEGTCIVPQIDW